MADRSYPQEWVQLLPEEAARWVRDGLISDGQREQILKLYPARPAAGRDRTVLILSILGTLLLGAGVILFFASNWAWIPAGVKVTAIVAAVVGVYGAGYHLQFGRGDYPRIGQALILLGGLFYGAAIWLIAQIFHLESHYPTAFFIWSVGVLPVAWAVESPLVLYLATILLGIWTGAEQGGFGSYNYLFPLIIVAVQMPLARRLRTNLAEAGALAGLFFWFVMNVGMHDLQNASSGHGILVVARTAMLYGSALLALGLAGVGEVRTYMATGSLAALVGTFALTFHHYRPENTAYPSLFAGSAFTRVGLGIMLLVAAAGSVLALRRAPGSPTVAGVAAVAVMVVAAALANLLPETLRMIAFNVLLLAGTIGLIVAGIQRRSELLVNLGLVIFVIHVLTRYADLFFEALDKSLFFVLGGIILLGGGWLLERNRRRWMQEWGGDGRDA